ncbi:hypothetical protein [Gracilinema caldarium]|uniref:Uncharacterized protein n=1 Tax=Gracilinema caldarium (strain ATCC 51460 / DSM 7334 / H1) TaxID=744872 RepID=F8EYB6_GRAC1|nr:hypothetical protein [Gracilinema caldarium]AEJ18275.1 hypothetical protein Spica_0106 [Gracilinema caldarium DSM 7334]
MTIVPIKINVRKDEIQRFVFKYRIKASPVSISCNPNEEVWINKRIGYNHEEDRVYIEGYPFIKK